jgi:hypothetical protein
LHDVSFHRNGSGQIDLQVRVASRENGCQKQRICKMRKDANPKVLHSNHIRTGGSSSRCRGIRIKDSIELGIIPWDDNAAGQSSANEENPEPEIDCLESPFEVLSRMRCLSAHHSDIFRANDREAAMDY